MIIWVVSTSDIERFMYLAIFFDKFTMGGKK